MATNRRHKDSLLNSVHKSAPAPLAMRGRWRLDGRLVAVLWAVHEHAAPSIPVAVAGYAQAVENFRLTHLVELREVLAHPVLDVG